MSGALSLTAVPEAQLLGRQREREVLDRLLDAARSGHGRVLVVHGEPGVGKTALLAYAIEAAREFRITRTAGVEGEMQLAYASLQRLCSPILRASWRSPRSSARCTGGRVRTRLRAGSQSLPCRTGGPRPAVGGGRGTAAPLCRRRRAMARCALLQRRLRSSPAAYWRREIALVFATREHDDTLTGFPQLYVEPLGHRDARALLEIALSGRLDEPVLERIIIETPREPTRPPRTADEA